LNPGGIRTYESSKSFGSFKAGIVQERIISFDHKSMTFEYEAISGFPVSLLKLAIDGQYKK